ncbi:SpoVR family protein [Acidihalobacter yilgarnensis]|uniref:SpoVR family protein n=1 Tax=Acidihalobacter yilgarnensis TaxID=2819280 RepID=A0A1D8IKV5_9GAMM|nr:SpoVR family protein [Acidihalobacter yilgarnensis]AOU97087.1 SpoVR family protein [Acidihalobacter yilgarnensis]
MRKKCLSEGSEWTFELIQRYEHEIARVAAHYGLDTYPNQIEIISAEQMMDAYSSSGMPVGYNYWSYGKQFIAVEQRYKRGQMGLAYEIVINSDPCIAYLMEENTMMMQALVVAHASYGHNSFFKGNYLFRTWTNADGIIDYLLFAKNYISQCEERYGEEAVELLLDSCHALMNYGVDRYKRPTRLSAQRERARQQEREAYQQSQVNDLWRTLPVRAMDESFVTDEARFPGEPQENLLYFIEKHAPLLEPWQREVVRIVRKIAQYFFPQRQTQVMNEGWATFWHHTIINHLYDEGLLSDGFMLEFMQSHTNVVFQPGYDDPRYSGINPYALGFAMMTDIRRICERPNEEDRQWFPELAGSDWLQSLDFAMRNFKDESFIVQYLSPKVIRDLKLFAILDDDSREALEVSAIHDDMGYHHVRNALAELYNLGSREPDIQVYRVDRRGDRSLTLRHTQHNRRELGESTDEVLRHVARLWGFDVRLESVFDDGSVELTHSCQVPH